MHTHQGNMPGKNAIVMAVDLYKEIKNFFDYPVQTAKRLIWRP